MTVEEIVARAINPDAWWNYDNPCADNPFRENIVEPSMRHARAALRALESSGYVSVPREPTQAMLDAPVGWTWYDGASSDADDMRDIWRAMLDAAAVPEEAK